MSDRDTPIPDEELISAYHDGELSGEDLARAEQLLATQPELRQLLEDLRAMSASLGAVPRTQLGDEFPARVLRKAEREMFTSAAKPAAKPAEEAAKPAAPIEPARTSALRWPRGRRPWLYAAAALAAAIVIMLFDNSRDRVAQQVADAPRNERADRVARDPGAFEAAPAPATTAAAPVDALQSAAPEAKSAPASALAPAAPAAAPPMAKSSNEMPNRPTIGARMSVPDREALARQEEAERVSNLSRNEALRESLTALGLEKATTAVETQAAQTEQAARVASAPMAEGVLVVECNVKPAALKLEAFNQICANNAIIVDKAGAPAADKAADKDVDASQSAGARKLVEGDNKSPAAGTPLDMFYVIATPSQLEGTLAELRQNQLIEEVIVKPMPSAPVQQRLQEYSFNRRAGSANLQVAKDELKEKAGEKQAAGDKPQAKLATSAGAGAAADQKPGTRNQPAQPAAPAGAAGQVAGNAPNQTLQFNAGYGNYGRAQQLAIPQAAQSALAADHLKRAALADEQAKGAPAKKAEAAAAASQPAPASSTSAPAAEPARQTQSQLRLDVAQQAAPAQQNAYRGAEPYQRALFVFRAVDAPEAAKPVEKSDQPADSKK